MENRYHYASVSKALEELNTLGFTIDYNLQEGVIMDYPDSYQIVKIYRYEGDSNPDDEAVVYGIKANSGEKGVFVAGFSANSESDAAKVLRELTIKSDKR